MNKNALVDILNKNELVERVNELENQVENLTLYLSYVRVNAPGFWSILEDYFDGMGGYSEQDESKLNGLVRHFEKRG